MIWYMISLVDLRFVTQNSIDFISSATAKPIYRCHFLRSGPNCFFFPDLNFTPLSAAPRFPTPNVPGTGRTFRICTRFFHSIGGLGHVLPLAIDDLVPRLCSNRLSTACPSEIDDSLADGHFSWGTPASSHRELRHPSLRSSIRHVSVAFLS